MFAPPPRMPLSKAEVEARLVSARTKHSSPTKTKDDANSPGLRAEWSVTEGKSRSKQNTRRSRQDAASTENRITSIFSPNAATSPPRVPPPPPPWFERSAAFHIQNEERLMGPLSAFESPRKAPVPPQRHSKRPFETPFPTFPSSLTADGHISMSKQERAYAKASVPSDIERSPASRGDNIRPSALPTPPMIPLPLFSDGSRPTARHSRKPSTTRWEFPSDVSTPLVGLDVIGIRAGRAWKTSLRPRSSQGVLFSVESLNREGIKSSSAAALHAKSCNNNSDTAQRRSAAQRGKLRPQVRHKSAVEVRAGSVKKANKHIARPHSKAASRTKRHTVVLLLESGFFSEDENAVCTALNNDRAAVLENLHIILPQYRSFAKNALPLTPGSILLTPIEAYFRAPKALGSSARNGGSSNSLRSPLSLVSNNHAGVHIADLVDESEHHPSKRLPAIPENMSAWEDSPPKSGTATPLATQKLVRDDPVVTVTPMEVNAWKHTLYIPGPIKLPTPTLMPRKQSIASLEAFREVVDQMYENVLPIPRRKSADSDDVCDFFDDFGLEMGSWKGNPVVVPPGDEEHGAEGIHVGSGRSSTILPEQQAATPVEKIVAKEALEMAHNTSYLSKYAMLPLVVPPIENEETLRAKGIASLGRLSRNVAGSAKAQIAFGSGDAVMTEKRTCEESTTLPVTKFGDGQLHNRSASGDLSCEGDEIEEIDAASLHSWVAPGKAGWRGVSTGKMREAAGRMRRLVGSTSTAA